MGTEIISSVDKKILHAFCIMLLAYIVTMHDEDFIAVWINTATKTMLKILYKLEADLWYFMDVILPKRSAILSSYYVHEPGRLRLASRRKTVVFCVASTE